MGMKKESLIASYLLMGGLGISPALFGVGERDEEAEAIAFRKLGNGFELRPLDIENNKYEYFHLYKDGVKVSDEVFRRGGLGSDFRDGYCGLIHYEPKKDKKRYPEGFGDLNHVLVNEKGEIVLRSQGLDYVHHVGGNVGLVKHAYYNLLTGEAIMPKVDKSIKGTNFLIVEHRYSWDYVKKVIDVPVGVYNINLLTCEVIKIDDIQ
jgi:hypothetical protein